MIFPGKSTEALISPWRLFFPPATSSDYLLPTGVQQFNSDTNHPDLAPDATGPRVSPARLPHASHPGHKRDAPATGTSAWLTTNTKTHRHLFSPLFSLYKRQRFHCWPQTNFSTCVLDTVVINFVCWLDHATRYLIIRYPGCFTWDWYFSW